MTTDSILPTIAVIGGTGKEGKGLAYRWAKAGYHIIIGSRTAEKAEAAAEDLNRLLNAEAVKSMENGAAAKAADMLVITVPYSAHASTLEMLRDAAQSKIVVDVTVPLVPPKVMKVQMPEAGSAAQEAQAILGEHVNVVAAFQNIAYHHLMGNHPIDCDVLVAGKGKAARLTVLKLVEAAGMHGIDAGVLENAMVVEGLTSLLIYINKQNRVKSAGIRITGLN